MGAFAVADGLFSTFLPAMGRDRSLVIFTTPELSVPSP
jgi:hypothetical protein